MDLKNNDILIFKNGNRSIYTSDREKIIQQYYDDNLNCLTNDDYSIIKIYRPHYELIYGDSKVKRKTNDINR